MASNIAHLKPNWQRGQSGNPAGRPVAAKGKHVLTPMRKLVRDAMARAGNAGRFTSVLPQPPEALRRQLGIANRVLDNAVTKPRLQRPRIMARIRQRIPAAVTCSSRACWSREVCAFL